LVPVAVYPDGMGRVLGGSRAISPALDRVAEGVAVVEADGVGTELDPVSGVDVPTDGELLADPDVDP
jgi:hypothetical protein